MRKKKIEGFIKCVGTQVSKEGGMTFVQLTGGQIDFDPSKKYRVEEI